MESGIAFVALGSNLQQPQQQVLRGMDALATLPGTRLLARSSLYHTQPVGYKDQPAFVNAVVKLSTQLPPQELLWALLELEREFGRCRTFDLAPRTLDLDVLLYDAQRLDVPGLTLPHPRMQQRAFVLVPLLEIAPDCVIPGLGPAIAWLPHTVDDTPQIICPD